jgi:hypothetical protein
MAPPAMYDTYRLGSLLFCNSTDWQLSRPDFLICHNGLIAEEELCGQYTYYYWAKLWQIFYSFIQILQFSQAINKQESKQT